MIIFLSMAMTVVAVGFIIYPMLKQKMGRAIQVENTALQELSSKRDTAYAMLKEVEFDYQSGILVEEDYRALEDRYKQKAVSILKEIHSLSEADDELEREIHEFKTRKEEPQPPQGVDDIETEILKLRRKKEAGSPPHLDDGIEEEIKRYRKTAAASGVFCTHCGTKSEAEDQYCANCGTELKHKEKVI